MRVMLDGTPLAISGDVIDEGKEAIYEAAKKIALSNNSVIVKIAVDGVSIEDEDAFFSLSGGIDIQFSSQPVIDLVRESVSEGEKYMPALVKGLQGIATMIEENNETGAKNSFSQAIDGINWLISVFARSCALLGINADDLKSGKWSQDSAELNRVLEEMISVMESGRLMRLAYIIRENLVPVVQKFSAYWSEIASQLDSPLH
ncbi:MAG: hypothetical protein LBR87_05045 [Synergistaceae bacterium]|jgi:hypothetical protein|nr:hypothetical protein [Synergistaceae bacterium]